MTKYASRSHKLAFNFLFIYFYHFLALFYFPLLPVVQGRTDGDTDAINESFKSKIKYLHDEEHDCEVNGQKATAKVTQPFQMPTCLKYFYENSNLPLCGKPMYSKFKYCAKSLFSENKDYSDMNFKDMFMKNKQILLLIDGCLDCRLWPDRAANLTIELGQTKNQVTKTQSDVFGDFKIGAILTLAETKAIQPFLKIIHQCNQYKMQQTKTVRLPVLYPHRMYQLTFEAERKVIQLIQQGKLEKIEKWVELPPSKLNSTLAPPAKKK